LTRLRSIIFGGEQFPARPLRALMQALPETGFYNVYGSTEVLVGTCHRLSAPPAADAWIPIGRPRPDAETLVLGEGEKPAADGEVGVLCIQSPSVMFCYWRRAELTERAFYSREARSFYRTGDLVELGRDGNYYFVGRRDRQVKSRGYRVELEEIEAALRTHPQVHDARVHLVPHGDEVGRITAAVMLRDHATLTVPGLKTYLAGRLPLYAVPTTIAFVGDPLSVVGAVGAERRELQR